MVVVFTHQYDVGNWIYLQFPLISIRLSELRILEKFDNHTFDCHTWKKTCLIDCLAYNYMELWWYMICHWQNI